MLAEEMGSSKSRGQVIWILASSRPDLIEVDLKRPGRVDVKIPLFPTATAAEGFALLSMVAKKRGLMIPENLFSPLRAHMPLLLTPGAADALVMNIYRQVKTTNAKIEDVVSACVAEYQNPIAAEVMDFQIELARREATALEFVPNAFRGRMPARPRELFETDNPKT